MKENTSDNNNPQKRYLITKGELPMSGSGGKASPKEKIIFTTIIIMIIVVIVIVFYY